MKSFKQSLAEDKREFTKKELIIMWLICLIIAFPMITIGVFTSTDISSTLLILVGSFILIQVLRYQSNKYIKHINELLEIERMNNNSK